MDGKVLTALGIALPLLAGASATIWPDRVWIAGVFLVAGLILLGVAAWWFWLPSAVHLNRIPLIRLRDKAAKRGWDMGPNSLNIADLADAIRQAGLANTLTIWARPDRVPRRIALTHPLEVIPPEHWQDHQIDFATLQDADDNLHARQTGSRTATSTCTWTSGLLSAG